MGRKYRAGYGISKVFGAPHKNYSLPSTKQKPQNHTRTTLFEASKAHTLTAFKARRVIDVTFALEIGGFVA
jgi:hypothetical protein